MQATSGSSSVASQPTQPIDTTSKLYLRIHKSFLCQLPNSHVDPSLPPKPKAKGHLIVLASDLSAIKPYAGSTVDWLIHVANLLFDPQGNGSLYTFTKGASSTWMKKDMVLSKWRRIDGGEELRSTIYEFRPFNNNPVSITRIIREGTVGTNNTASASSRKAKAFRTALIRRDEACVISRISRPYTLIASHLIPKCLGDAGIAEVVKNFVESPPANVARFDPMLGVLVAHSLDPLVDSFGAGFYKVGSSGNTYIVHTFIGDDPNETALGGSPRTIVSGPALHGTKIKLLAHSATPLPPSGVFNWHYLQCVMNKFGSQSYKVVENIAYSTIPFHATDDEDPNDEDPIDEDPNDEDRGCDNAPYPTYWLDKLLSCEYERVERAERHRDITNWRLNI